MQFKFDKGFFGRLTLLLCMTFFFYHLLKPSKLDHALIHFNYLNEQRIHKLYQDKERFKNELHIIQDAAYNGGDERALTKLFYLTLYARGEASAIIPNLQPYRDKHPELCRKIIESDPDLKVFKGN